MDSCQPGVYGSLVSISDVGQRAGQPGTVHPVLGE